MIFFVDKLAWRSERCTGGFVTAAVWDFDPSAPAVREHRHSETKHGFPFDHAYFGVWRGDKAEELLDEITRKGSAIFRAPPYSGKTAMMQCIAIVASRIPQGRKVFPLSFMGFQSFHESKKTDLSLTEIFELYWEHQSGKLGREMHCANGMQGTHTLIGTSEQLPMVLYYCLMKSKCCMNMMWKKYFGP